MQNSLHLEWRQSKFNMFQTMDIPRRLLLCVLFLANAMLCSTIQAGSYKSISLSGSKERFSFDIASQPLANSLIRFNLITGIPVIYESKLSKDEYAEAIYGVYTAKQALDLILRKTGLQYHQSIKGVITLSYKGNTNLIEDTLVVTGQRVHFSEYTSDLSFYGDIDSTSAKLPQTIKVIDNNLFREFGSSSIDEALEHVSGIEYLGSLNGISTDLALRGFISPAIAIDGLIHPSPSLLPEISTIEKIEVIKGPPSVLYGAFRPGGVINVIRKKPSFTPHKSMKLSTDSYDSIKSSFDLGGAIDDNSAYQLNTSLEKKNSFRDFVSHTSYSFAPTFNYYHVDGGTTSIRSDIQHKSGSVDTFLYTNESGPLRDIPIEQSYGEEWESSTVDFRSHSINYKKPLSINRWPFGKESVGELSITAHYLEQQYDSEYVVVVDDIPLTLPGKVYRTPAGMAQGVESSNLDIHHQWQWNLENFTLKNTAGIDYLHYSTITSVMMPRNMRNCIRDSIAADEPPACLLSPEVEKFNQFNPYDPQYNLDKPNLATAASYTEKRKVGSIYLQSLIEYQEDITILMGIRNDHNKTNGVVDDQIIGLEQLTPDAGGETKGIHFGVSRSLRGNLSIHINTSRSDHIFIERYQTEQWEIGFKAKQLLGRWDLDVTAFSLDQTEIITGPNNSSIAGFSTPPHFSQGVEWDISGWITPHLRLSNSTSLILSKLHTSEIDGIQIENYRPSHQANELSSLWASYFPQGVNQGFNFNIGIRYVGDRYADELNRIKQEAYTRIDANISYRKTNRFRISLNIENIQNVRYDKGNAAQLFKFDGINIPGLDESSNDLINRISKLALNAGGTVPGAPLNANFSLEITF